MVETESDRKKEGERKKERGEQGRGEQ